MNEVCLVSKILLVATGLSSTFLTKGILHFETGSLLWLYEVP